jgi:hypothetical protein
MSSLIVNTGWHNDPEIFIGTIIDFYQIPNGSDLPVIEMIIENSFERYRVVMWQPHPDLQLTKIPDSAVQLMLWSGKAGHAVSRSDTVILLDTPDSLLHLPQSQLYDPNIVAGIEWFIAACPVPALADLVRRIIGRPSIGIPFTNAPAIDIDHRGKPGGLAIHSLNVAKRALSSCAGFSDDERWSAAVAGLLHGVGRIRVPQPTNAESLRVILSTLKLISDDLRWLEGRAPVNARMIQHIITSMYRRSGRLQTHPLALAVQTADRLAVAQSTGLATEKELFLKFPPVNLDDQRDKQSNSSTCP